MTLDARKKLYRRVNTKAHNVSHAHGKDYADDRQKSKLDDKSHESMHGQRQRGLDYSPLYKYLISKVGCNWNDIYHDVKNRIDKDEPIFRLVAKYENDKQDIVRLGESSYYSGLYIDDNNVLQIVNPDIKIENLTPFCNCCTHTFNGIPYVKKFKN